jgi:heavy metal sensor kinase
MSFAQFKSMLRTLRFRLLAWNATVVALTAVVTLVGMQVGVRKALLHEIDQFLLDGLEELCPLIESATVESLPAANEPSSTVHLHFGQRLAAVLDQSGQVLWSSDGKALAIAAPIVDGQPASIGDFRVVQRHVRDANGKDLVAQVGIPLEVIDANINRVDALALSFAAALLVIAPFVGYWLAGRAVSPLRELILQTSRLRPTKLDDRLPIRNSGDELDQLAGTINGLLNRIASYLTHREDFVANAAHELRNPVAAIRSTAEVTLASKRSGQEYEQVLEEMIDECARLESLVSQLLLLAESDANRLRVHEQRLDLSEVVQHAAATFGPAAQSLDILVDVSSCPAPIEGNRHHLQQVVSNLLDNALKFTPAGGRISMSLNTDPSTQEVVLMVSDSGIGIPSGDLPLVFERFHRGENARYSQASDRGAGLGLSICKSIVEAHRGSIRVESVAGSGTKFIVRLPLVRSSTEVRTGDTAAVR